MALLNKVNKQEEESEMCFEENLPEEMETMTISDAEQERENAGDFGRLPEETILNIFKKLPSRRDLVRLAPVCRLFSRIAEDSTLWKEVCLFDKRLEEETLNALMRRQTEHLRIIRSRILSRRSCESSVALGPDYEWCVVELNLSITSIEPDVLMSMLTTCRQLEELHLTDESLEITDDILKAIAANKELRVLHMTFSQEVSADALANLLKSCVKLRSLDLKTSDPKNPFLTRRATGKIFNPRILDAICGNLPSSLRKLNIQSDVDERDDPVEDKNVAQIVANCPHLTKLHLYPASRLTEEAVKTMSTLPLLQRYIDVRGIDWNMGFEEQRFLYIFYDTDSE